MYNDNIDPVPLSMYNRGKFIEIREKEIRTLQIWLTKLGYLDNQQGFSQNPDKDYTQGFGGLTISAVHLYQLNHALEITQYKDSNIRTTGNGKYDNDIADVDDITYSTIANEYFNLFGNGENEYTDLCDEKNISRAYSNSINIIEPNLKQKFKNASVIAVKTNNEQIYDKEKCNRIIPMYFYDYSVPISKMVNSAFDEFTEFDIVSTATPISLIKMIYFINQVMPNAKYNIKVKSSWNVLFKDIDYTSQKFTFIFNGININSEDLGNITFGLLGAHSSYTLEFLLTCSNIVANCFSLTDDDLQDKLMMEYGFNLYESWVWS